VPDSETPAHEHCRDAQGEIRHLLDQEHRAHDAAPFSGLAVPYMMTNQFAVSKFGIGKYLRFMLIEGLGLTQIDAERDIRMLYGQCGRRWRGCATPS
jgi:hypothetical protein